MNSYQKQKKLVLASQNAHVVYLYGIMAAGVLYLALSDKKKESNKRSDAKTYERFSLLVRQEWEFRDIAKQAAEACGESVNGFMVKAIRDKVEAAGFAFPVPVLPDKEEQ